ncbi:MAG: copper amine oxidase-like protein [Paenibacillaceae bacterium]|jgi:hypothetical protein|nr:copper amine oxidase-like protein [Paenibacillaceae bacterium]
MNNNLNKKWLTGILSAAVLSLSAAGVHAAENAIMPVNPIQGQIEQSQPAIQPQDQIEQARFNSFTGTVKEIHPAPVAEGTADKGRTYVLVEDQAGGLVNFLVTADTYMVTDAKLAVGATVTGFYDATLPVIMIYPPQYEAVVLAVDFPQDQSIKVDRFDGHLVSADNQLKLNLADDTKIILPDGQNYEGELANRNLAVIYDVSTKSIPAQTTPLKVIVLPEAATPPVQAEPGEANHGSTGHITGMPIVVNGNLITAPAPYTAGDGTAMVPLRAIAEALGFTVTWDEASWSVTLDQSISLTVDKDSYAYQQGAPVQLGTPPVLAGETTYVPLQFFKEVARMNAAGLSDGQIVIGK